ncbi:UNVERIFIED_CONTAM: hypothetical protein FKN15_066331 [Acipenser sinensis]
MPRAFLVKKQWVSAGTRNWSDLPDEQRGEIYIPVSLGFSHYAIETEASPAEAALCLSTRPPSAARDSGYQAELPSCNAKGVGQSSEVNDEPPTKKDSTYVRSKIKAFTQRCSLESHMKKIHAVMQLYAYKERRNKLYVCEECGYTADSQESQLTHLRERHPQSHLLQRKNPRKLTAGLCEEDP